MNAEETKRKNNEIIEQLRRENKELKKTRDELTQTKRVLSFERNENKLGRHSRSSSSIFKNWWDGSYN